MKDELKYKDFQPERHRIRSKKELWRRVEAGIRAAEITIVDPVSYETAVRYGLEAEGAEFGHDFNDNVVRELAGNAILQDSPLNAAAYSENDFFADNSTHFGRPLRRFSASAIKSRVGGKLKHAVLTAARAHAMVSPSEHQELTRMCSGESLASPARTLTIIQRMARVFDIEHPKSVAVLNEFIERIAHASGLRYVFMAPSGEPLVIEANSQSVAHLQGADVAAGWAVDTLMMNHGDLRTLAQHLAWVSSNGVVIPNR